MIDYWGQAGSWRWTTRGVDGGHGPVDSMSVSPVYYSLVILILSCRQFVVLGGASILILGRWVDATANLNV